MTHLSEAAISPKNIREQQMVSQMDAVLPDKQGHIINTIAVNPNVSFDGQNENEKVFILIRRHVITNSYWIIRDIIIALVPIFFLIIGNVLSEEVHILEVLPVGAWAIIFCGWYLLTLGMIVYPLFEWFYNVWIVTSERVIDINFKPLIGRRISETALENVQDITELSPNFMANLFNFGHMRLQTASENVEFEFKSAPNPSWLRDKILDLANIRKQILND